MLHFLFSYVLKVQKVLVQLDLTGLQDIHADALSGRQKRKLSLAIAILGNPQVSTGHTCTHTVGIVLAHSFAFWFRRDICTLILALREPADLVTHLAARRIKESRSMRTL